MIKISLDEAYVFDLLSIYEVKFENSSDEKKEIINKSIMILSNEIKEQIGDLLFEIIIKSSEYISLKQSNREVFKLVDRANETELSKLTADANYKRYVEKTKLQHKFFDNKLTEIKIVNDTNIT